VNAESFQIAAETYHWERTLVTKLGKAIILQIVADTWGTTGDEHFATTQVPIRQLSSKCDRELFLPRVRVRIFIPPNL
jgi:hypothetical protein